MPHTVLGLDAEHVTRLVAHLPVIVWSTDLQLRLTSRYGGALAEFAHEAGVVDGPHISTFSDPRDAEAVLAAHAKAIHGESAAYETRFRGRVFTSRVDPLKNAAGEIVGTVGFAVDMTEKQRAETALRESESRLRTIIASEPECVKVVDPQGRLLEMNPAGLGMIEAENIDQVRGHPVIDLIASEYRAEFAALHGRVIAGESGTLQFEMIGLKGTRRWLETQAVPLRDAAGRVQALLGITRDITDARRAEEQVQASRAALRNLATREQHIREDERTRIAREIHDSLGQALTALKLQLAAARQQAARHATTLDGPLSETALMVDDLVKSVRRIASELRPPILDQLGLPAAVEWMAQDFTRHTGIACRVTVVGSQPTVRPELGTALFRIVQESLTNVLRHADATAVEIELGMKSNCVTLEINDDGSGITEAGTSGPGSLGILGMRERAAALGGLLEVAPRPRVGTRVTAWVPITVERPKTPAKTQAQSRGGRRRRA
jgi:two-component system, NarL family, sensor histidine kinase UhpB